MTTFQSRLAEQVDVRRKANRPDGRLRVGILSRMKTREIVHFEEIKNQIEQLLLETNVQAECKELLFEGTSFELQVYEIARLDILLAAHGAGSSNLIFMREGSVFIEVIPFDLASNFRRLSRHARLVYRNKFAQPDEARVLLCANRRLKHDGIFLPLWRMYVASPNSSSLCPLDDTVSRRECLRAQSLAIQAPQVQQALIAIVRRHVFANA